MYGSVFVATLAAMCLLSLRAGRRVKTGEDYSLAGRSLPAAGVAWVIIGTLVGGAATVGTVQTAYTWGISAWIFALGSGLGCLVLGLFFSRALREENVVTVAEYIGRHYGRRMQLSASLFTSLGMFIQLVAQFLAAIAVLQGAFGVSKGEAFAAAFLVICTFVVAGGLSGSNVVGKVKCYLLYAVMAGAAGVALVKAGGFSALAGRLPPGEWFNLFSYGAGKGAADIGAMIVGVVSTQTYLQAIFAAKDVREARRGCFFAAGLIPPVGLFGVVVGLYLRGAHPELAHDTAQALPFFLGASFPAPLAAFGMAAIFVSILGTTSGLVLGVSTNLYVDFLRGFAVVRGWTSELLKVRLCSVAVLAASLLLVFTGLDSSILEWSYTSMGLRGSAVFIALFPAVFLRHRMDVKRLAPLVFLCPILYAAWAILSR